MTASLTHVNMEHALMEWVTTHANVKQDIQEQIATQVRMNLHICILYNIFSNLNTIHK